VHLGDPVPTTTAHQLEQARQKLLDLSMRNRLLNYRPSKQRSITVVGEAPAEVYEILVLKEKPLHFRPTKQKRLEPDQEPAEFEEIEEPLGADEWDEVADTAAHHIDRYLDTPFDEDALSKRLFHVYHEGHTLIEEQGYSVVHLAVAFLQWFESDEAIAPRKAPLMLVPAELERVRAGDFSRVKWTGEDVYANVSLAAKLTEQGVVLPPFAQPEDKLQFAEWLKALKAAIARKPRWRITTDIVLDFFSFTKFVMYKDLDPTAWPPEQQPQDHGLLRSLFEPEPRNGEADGFSENDVDRKLSSRDPIHVTDADPSQIAVIEDAKAGRNLVVEGPPGTGKSQTITNLVAETLAAGKTVLFVSEKMAALEVVKNRLDRAGLAPFCLELHSRKTNKKAVLEELHRSLQSSRPSEPPDALYEEHESLRSELNAYARDLSLPVGRSGWSAHQLFELRQRASKHFERVGRRLSLLPSIERGDSIEPNAVAAAERALQEVSYILPLVAPASTNVWRTSTIELFLPDDEVRLTALLATMNSGLQQLRDAAGELERAVGLSELETLDSVGRLCRAAEVMIDQRPTIDRELLLSEAWNSSNAEAETRIERVVAFQRTRDDCAGRFTEAALADSGVAANVEEFRRLAQRFFRIFSSRYRALRRELAAMFRGDMPRNAEAVTQLEGLLSMQAERGSLAGDPIATGLFGGAWKAGDSDVSTLRQLATWLVSFREQVVAKALSSRAFEIARAGVEDTPAVRVAIDLVRTSAEAVKKGLREVAELLKLEPPLEGTLPLTAIADQVAEWSSKIPGVSRWAQFNAACRSVRDTVAAPIERLLKTEDLDAADLLPAFRLALSESLLRHTFVERPALARFAGEAHERKIARFQELDRKLLKLNSSRLLRRLHELRPSLSGGVAPSSEAGILLGELNRKRNHLPIRQLLVRAGRIVQRIKPCFLMSPLSVAQFLDARSVSFDLIVFDEASQVRPEDALGALLRGRQLVVMGDSKQLPPTSFFAHLVEETDAASEDEESSLSVTEIESILHQCKRSYLSKYLTWHYRSKHDSLIAVSNWHFYENRLRAFPSAFDLHDEYGLHFKQLPDTIYDRGKSGTNREEAKKVARASIEHFRKWGDERSLGVGTFNLKQQQAIQEEIEIELRANPDLEPYFRSDRDEHFFVKNLETIQGDERDVIFISMGYGRDAQGRMSMNFGPLNNEGGERRLNVLITRARMKSVVFSNFTYNDISLESTSSRGVFALKSFLEFAQNRQLVAVDVPLEDTDSPFEDAVYDVLYSRGLIVRKQVGCAGYRIDLAVADPDRPGSYLLGVECDGAKYHSSPVARDRDRLRQQILEGLGWRIHRIWSTDWYRNRNETVDRLLAAVERAREERASEPTPAERAAAPPPEPAPEPLATVERIVPARPWWEEIPSYRQCDRLSSIIYYEDQPAMIAPAVEEVLAVEGPIHFEELARRLARLFGFGRAGSSIQAAIGKAVNFLQSQRKIERSRDFVRLAGQEVRLRRRTGTALTRIDLICDNEIALAIQRALDVQFNASREDVIIQASRALGFSATHADTARVIGGVLDTIAARGEVALEDGMVRRRT